MGSLAGVFANGHADCPLPTLAHGCPVASMYSPTGGPAGGCQGGFPSVKSAKLRNWEGGSSGCKHCLPLENKVLHLQTSSQISRQRYVRVKVIFEAVWVSRKEETMPGGPHHSDWILLHSS